MNDFMANIIYNKVCKIDRTKVIYLFKYNPYTY